MKKHELAEARIKERLRQVQWNSFGAIRGLFCDRGYYPPRQSISDTTIRRVLMKLRKEGVIECKWKCVYPRFFLAFSWVGDNEEA